MKVLRVYHAGRDASHRQRDRALVRAGVDVTLVVPALWPGPNDSGPEPFEIISLPVRRAGDVNRHTYVEPTRIDELVQRLQPDVVDLHEEPFSSVVHQLLRRLPDRQPVVAYAAQNIDKRFPPPFARRERYALSRLQGLYPCSKQAASVSVGKGFGGIVSVLPLGVPIAAHPGTQRMPTDLVQLLLAGRLVPEKGVQDAVRVLAAVRARHPARLLIAGDGPQRDPALHLARELRVADDVCIEPWLGRDDLARRYATAHVVLAPSSATRTWVEQFGRMVGEAKAAGAVVAGYASGALPEVVGDSGILVAGGDVGALAGAILDLLAEPDRWWRLRERGLATAGTLGWDAIAAGQLELYRRVATTGCVRNSPARRADAVARFGPPATVAGGGRPFAVPVLRANNAAARALGWLVDRIPGSDR